MTAGLEVTPSEPQPTASLGEPVKEQPGAAPPLGFGVRLGYGFGSLAYGVSATVLSGSVLQLYFNQVIGLNAAWVGMALALTIIVDSVIDPVIGRFSDNLRSRWGRRHLLMYASALPSAIGIVLMWHAPQTLGTAGLLVFMVGMLLFVRVAVSFYEIPSLALAPELAPDYHDRTALIAWRYFFIYGGAAAMNAILFQVFLREDAANPLGALNRERYAEFGLFAAVVIFVVIITASLSTHGRIRHLHIPAARKTSLRQTAKEMIFILSHRPLQFLMGTTLLNGFGGGVQFGLQAYFFLHYWLLKPQEVAYVLFVSPFAAIIMLWAAPRISARIGKKPFLMACYLGWAISFVLPFVGRALGLTPPVGSNELLALLVASGFLAVAFSIGFLIMFNSLLADAADDIAVKSGLRSEGVLYAAFGLLDKWGAALGAVIAGLLLTWVAFPAKAIPGTVDMAIMNRLIFTAVPLIVGGNIIAMFIVSRFGIDQATHEANLEELRRGAALSQE
ncbi:MAG: MFS transporter [Caulobacter sp.]|nr:MFS transporter [Caulobacter sp.]